MDLFFRTGEVHDYCNNQGCWMAGPPQRAMEGDAAMEERRGKGRKHPKKNSKS